MIACIAENSSRLWCDELVKRSGSRQSLKPNEVDSVAEESMMLVACLTAGIGGPSARSGIVEHGDSKLVIAYSKAGFARHSPCAGFFLDKVSLFIYFFETKGYLLICMLILFRLELCVLCSSEDSWAKKMESGWTCASSESRCSNCEWFVGIALLRHSIWPSSAPENINGKCSRVLSEKIPYSCARYVLLIMFDWFRVRLCKSKF